MQGGGGHFKVGRRVVFSTPVHTSIRLTVCAPLLCRTAQGKDLYPCARQHGVQGRGPFPCAHLLQHRAAELGPHPRHYCTRRRDTGPHLCVPRHRAEGLGSLPLCTIAQGGG